MTLHDASLHRLLTACAAAALLASPSPVVAQAAEPEPPVLRFEATPIGALPPIALPMPASRNHNYWGIRLQAGHRGGRPGPDLRAIAGGIDLQWHGGSTFGITGGYQARDCPADDDCGGHAMFGARARLNFITAGPTIGAMLGDYSATSTLGAEIGLGYAPEATGTVDACTVDVGMPMSLAMLQRVRLVGYITPGMVWEVDCAHTKFTRASFLTGIGVGVQQLGLRGLDAYVGFQKIFRTDTGYQFGLSITYVRLP